MTTNPTHPELRAELLSMMDTDQKAWRATRRGDGRPMPLYHSSHTAQNEVRYRHTQRLRQIIADHGWPLISMVGRDGAQAAWLIAQHADHDVDFRRVVLGLMTAAAKQGQVSLADRAYLLDRVAVASGEPQLFGTQLIDGPNGQSVFHPIQRPEQVDSRRRAVGLMPLADYLKATRATYATPNGSGSGDE